MLYHFLLCLPLQAKNSHKEAIKLQEKQLGLAFASVDLRYREKGVIVWSADGLARAIEMRHCTPGNIHVENLPHSVQKVSITSCSQHYKVNTRLLPRECILFNMSYNRIYGTVNLCELPPKIVAFHLQHNYIKEPVRLYNLPDSLHTIYLHANRIKQRVVFYEDLPEGMKKIDLQDNQIKKVENIDRGSKLSLDERIRIGNVEEIDII